MRGRALSSATIVGSLMVTMTTPTSVAPAAFTGLGATSLRATTSTGLEVDVFELFATFDTAADGAAAAGGTPLFPQTLHAGAGGFFQVTVFGADQNVPVGAGAVIGIPDLAYDSFVSIGVRQGFTGNPAVPTLQGFNLDDFNGGATDVVTGNGGWFIGAGPEIDALPYPPPLPVGATISVPPGATHGTFLGQFTVAAGNTFSGDLGQLLVLESGVARLIDNTSGATFSFTHPLPGPGTLAVVIALGGLARGGRRRG